MVSEKKILAMIFSVVVMVQTFACIGINNAGSSEKDFPVSISDSRNLEIFFFDPQTALTTLKEKDTIVLTQLTTTTSDKYLYAGTPQVKSEKYLWQYSDYLKVADVIEKQTWGDDAMLEWGLLDMSFDADCQDPLNGFSTADLYYFRPTSVNGKPMYAGREMLIRPLYGDIVSGFGSNYPYPLSGKWEGIDLHKLRITPNDALQIAETNGGKNFRTKENNKCWVYVAYVDGDKKWLVSYITHTGSNKLRMYIDQYSGDVNIISEK